MARFACISLLSVDFPRMHLRSMFEESFPCGNFETELNAKGEYLLRFRSLMNNGHMYLLRKFEGSSHCWSNIHHCFQQNL